MSEDMIVNNLAWIFAAIVLGSMVVAYCLYMINENLDRIIALLEKKDDHPSKGTP